MGKNEIKHGDNVKQSDSMQKDENAALSVNGVLAYLTATQPKTRVSESQTTNIKGEVNRESNSSTR
jgi:hypothetical protein